MFQFKLGGLCDHFATPIVVYCTRYCCALLVTKGQDVFPVEGVSVEVILEKKDDSCSSNQTQEQQSEALNSGPKMVHVAI